jgi:hypothetical protein
MTFILEALLLSNFLFRSYSTCAISITTKIVYSNPVHGEAYARYNIMW